MQAKQDTQILIYPCVIILSIYGLLSKDYKKALLVAKMFNTWHEIENLQSYIFEKKLLKFLDLFQIPHLSR